MSNENENKSAPSPQATSPTITTSWGWMREKWDTTMDEQRLDRLQQCQVLTEMLRDCRSGTKNRRHLEDTPTGIRMVRYFDWRDVPGRNCQREEHAVWACRAVALQCGSQLAVVKSCLDETGLEKVLTAERTGYEKASDTDKVPCLTQQQLMGACVSQAAVELQTRQEERAATS